MNIRSLARSLVLLPILGATNLSAQKALDLANVTEGIEFAFVRLPNSPELEPAALTIEAWIRPQGVRPGPAHGDGLRAHRRDERAAELQELQAHWQAPTAAVRTLNVRR